MAHIVIDARNVATSTGTYTERLLHYLQKLDRHNHYTVLIPSSDKDFWQPSADNFTVECADFKPYSVAEQTGLKRLLGRLGPDLVHFTMPQQPIAWRGRTVTTIHDLTLLKVYNPHKNWAVYKTKQLVGRYVFWQIARSSDAIIVPTEYTKHDLLEFAHISPDKVHVTYEAADVGQFTPEPYEVPFKRFIVNVGRQSEYKNIVRLAEAHQKLLSKYPDLGLVLVNPGDSASRANQALFDKRGYRNIHFAYGISGGQRDYLYQKATLYAVPSLHEGFGLGGLEAMGFGLPVVSSNASCLPEVYGDGALYFDPLNVDDTAAKIDEVLADDKARRALITRGHKRHSQFSWHKMAAETLEAYQDVLK